MSMLAEKKRKQKYVTNFRSQTSWTQDANKFGQRMLEKMGWKDGKGLGRNEDGLTKNISMVLKNDLQGLGFKESIYDSVQHDNFNTLLETLTDGTNESTSKDSVQIKSLEKRSEKSRVRVHYAKFTRGKDLSKYSEKDLANIFGKKNLHNENEVMAKKMDAEICGGSMHDYFKSKMKFANLKDNKVTQNETVKKSSKKSKKRKRNDEELALSEGVVNPGFDPLCTNVVTTKAGLGAVTEGIVNPGFDPLSKSIVPTKRSLDTIIENADESCSSENHEAATEEMEINEPDWDRSRKIKSSSKKRKKLPNDTGLNNPAFNLNTPDSGNSNFESYEVKPKEKKPKLSKAAQDGVSNPGFDINAVDGSVEMEEIVRSSKKKSKLRKVAQAGVINSGFDINAVDKSLQSEEVVRSSKKRGKMGIENQAYDVKMQNIEEIVSDFTDAIDKYQAEVENGINESKVGKKNRQKKSKRSS